MESQITIFNNPQFGDIRTAGTPEAPLFCLTDVCKALELQSSAVMRRLEKGVISSHPLDTAGGQQLANFVNEDGLYDVILDSRKPEAKVFRKWVTSEVLPAIRKTGGYLSTTSTMTDDEIMARALMVAQTTIKQHNERIRQLQSENEGQRAIIHQMQKAAPHKTFIGAPGADGNCSCNTCPFMALNTMEKLYIALRDLEPRIEIEELVALLALEAFDVEALLFDQTAQFLHLALQTLHLEQQLRTALVLQDAFETPDAPFEFRIGGGKAGRDQSPQDQHERK